MFLPALTPAEATSILHNNESGVNNDRFDNILSLVFHYMNVSGELPVCLTMPEILRETEGRKHLSSLAKLSKGKQKKEQHEYEGNKKKRIISRFWRRQGLL